MVRALRLAAILGAGLAWLVLMDAQAAFAARKVALVIGNSAYQSAPVLTNPANDADDLAAALKADGFEVVERRDADRTAMQDAIRDFAHKLDGASTALFFYAGHGLQVGGDNFLVPVDATIANAADVRFGTVNLNDILGAMEAETRANVVILDACRDNPFAAAVGQGGRSIGGRGLSRLDTTGVGTLVVYSTQPNNIALDGTGRNSPFTAALLKHIGTPGLEVRQMISEVRADVLNETDRKQVPWDNSSLVGDVYLAGPPATGGPQAAAPAAPRAVVEAPQAVADNSAAEIVFWEAVAKADTKEMYEGYLKQFGDNGQFAFLAHQRLDALTRQKAATAVPQTPAPPAVTASAPAAVPQARSPAAPTDCETQVAKIATDAEGKHLEGAIPVMAVTACKAALADHPNDPHFEVQLGLAYETVPDYVDANKQYQAAATQGDPQGMIHLGMNYERGYGLLKNGAKAFDLYTKAAELNEPAAIFLLGTLYEQGIGVPRDYAKARTYYEKGAELGQVNAVRSLGILYFNGWGMPKNYATALQYFEQAAALGNHQAMKLIGTIYTFGGWGVRRDMAKAREWNTKAADYR